VNRALEATCSQCSRPATRSPVSSQGPCKVSFVRSDLRGWGAAAQSQTPERPLWPPACMVSTPLPRRSERPDDRSVDGGAHIRHPTAASSWRHPARSAACVTTLHEPWEVPGQAVCVQHGGVKVDPARHGRAEAKSSDGHLTWADVTMRRLWRGAQRRCLVGGRPAGSL
jgi:hypothetical protein